MSAHGVAFLVWVSGSPVTVPFSAAKHESKMAAPGSPFAFLQDLALGGTSGVIAKTACAPLERVKILLQVRV
jgi:hypothetical protein